MDKVALGKRIAEARLSLGLNQSELARLLGIKPQSVQQWEKGDSAPKLERLKAIADILKVSLESLTGEKPMPVVREQFVETGDDIVKVPRFSAEASMGVGSEVHPDDELVLDFMPLSVSWLRQNVSCSSFRNLQLITGKGDSMVPTIEDGDILLVDTGIERVVSDAIYALNVGGELFVKRVQRNLDGGLIIISDNKEYEKMFISKTDIDNVRIIGRVVFSWKANRL